MNMYYRNAGPSWRRIARNTRAAFALLAVSSAAMAQGVPEELIDYADIVFYNGQVLTADADRDFSVTQAVAVRDERILSVGTTEQILRLAGPDTRRVDLNGRSVTPGFVYNDGDNSVPAGDLLKESQWNGRTQLHLGGETLDQALATVAFIIKSGGSKAGEPLFFNLADSWSSKAMQDWNIDTLDNVAPDTPIVIYLDSSYCLVNTPMIELALKTGFPENHFHLDRDSNGKLTGRGGAQLAGFIGREVRPWPEPAWFDEVAIPGAEKTLAKYARHGVTLATGHMSAATMTVLNRIFHDASDKLAVRVYPGLDFLRQNPEGEKYLKRIGNLVDFSLTDDRGPMVTIVGAAVGPHSGSPDAGASLLTIEPKLHVIPELSPNEHGYNRWTAEWFTGLGMSDLTEQQKKQTDFYNVLLARQHGWNVTGVHNMGSEAIRLAMQNVSTAEKQDNLYVKHLWRPNGFDHNIDWTDEVFAYYDAHPELKDIIRFGVNLRNVVNQRDAKPLGIKQVITAQWGEEGLERMAPLRKLLDHGIPFHIEGTEPEDDAQYPTWYMERAVTRIDNTGKVVAPEEALSREEALLALTRWPARFIGAEKSLGSIEPGKLADLVVFDGNLMSVDIDDLDTLKPVMTLVGGRVAYESQGL